eukprot:m.175482 g.175482  ORF g.175482 m.175482 type:complete len:1123 (+) comp39129_c0_seq17:277-3645(+)
MSQLPVPPETSDSLNSSKHETPRATALPGALLCLHLNFMATMLQKRPTALLPLILLLLLAVTSTPSHCLVDLAECSFETGTCGWKANGSFMHDWTVSSSSIGWLDNDHTFDRTGKGQYISAVGPSTSKDKGSLLESVIINPFDEICGIRFSYALDYHADLQVQVEPGGNVKSLIPSYLYWTNHVIPMQIRQPSKVVFVATFSRNFGGEAAIDDIQFLPCKRCTFEKDFCSWSSLVEDISTQIQWTRRTGSSSGPSVDHTILTSKGYYVYIGGSSNKGKNGQLMSKKIYYNDNVCSLRFFFYIYGTGGADSLEVKAIDDDNRTITNLTVHSGHTGSMWILYEITFPHLSRHQNGSTRFIFTGTLDGTSAGYVAIDDIEYLSCTSTDNCTFSAGTCSWDSGAMVASRDDALPWSLVPDYTYLVRNKLVANFSSNSIPPDQITTELEGRPIFLKDGICSLRVTYEMETSLLFSTLIVDVLTLDGTSVNTFDVVAVNNSGKPMQEEIAFTTFPVFVKILAHRNNDEMGSITLHDLQYLPCTYSSFESSATPSWQSVPDFPVQWDISSPCISPLECPTHDHTFGAKQEGHFFLAKSLSTPTNKIAAGFKWSDSSMPAKCGLRLWYYMSYGSTNVSVIEPGGLGKKYEALWRMTKTWVFSELAFRQAIQALKVEYTSVEISGFSLAFDDVQLTPCVEFTMCTFERTLCDWTPATDPYWSANANWIRWSGHVPGSDGSSTLDHTGNSSTGRYAYMAIDSEANGDKTAVLAGIPLGRKSRPCGVEFWYRIFRNESENAVAWLTVEQIFDTDSGRAILWNASDPTRGKWERVTVQLLPTMHQTVSIEFRGFTSTTANFNLDDIAYVEKDCAVPVQVPTPSPTSASMRLSTATAGTTVLSKETITSASTTPVSDSEKTSDILGTDNATPTLSKSPTKSSRRTDAAASKLYSSGFPTKSGTTPQTSVEKSSAAIIGGAVGGSTVLLIMVFLLIIIFLKKQQKQKTLKKLATSTSTSSVTAFFQNKSYEGSFPATSGMATKEPTYAEPNNSNRLPNDDDDMKENPSYRDPHIGRESSFSSGVSDHVYAMPDIKSTNRPPSRVSENILYEEAPDKRSSKRRESENAIYEGKETNQ